MKGIAWGLAALLVFGLTGCAGKTDPVTSASELLIIPSASDPSVSASVAAQPAASESATPDPPGQITKADIPMLGETVRRIVKSAVTAALVIDRQQAKTIYSENADRQFHSGSLVKLMIAVDALNRHPGDSRVADKVTTMIRLSDDEIASSFWVSEGGTQIVSRMVRAIDLRQTRPPVPAGQWGETLVSANDIARIYDYIMAKVPPADRTVIVNAMASAAAKGSDGFNQMFGIPSGLDNLGWAVKQAWTNNDTTMSCHTTGLVGRKWRYTVIVMTENPRATPWSSATRAVTEATKNLSALLTP